MKKALQIMTLIAVLVVPAFAEWSYTHSRDVITGENRSRVSSLNLTGDGGAVSFQYLEDGLNFIVLWNSYYGGDRDGRVHVIYRIDDRPAVGPQAWSILSRNRSAYMPMQDVAAFRRALTNANQLVIRVIDPSDGETKTFIYDMKGYRENITRL
jgi:hypothetical protein